MPLGKFLMHLGSAVGSSGPASVVTRYVLWINECFGGIYCLTPVSKVGKESPLECGIHPKLSFFLLSLL